MNNDRARTFLAILVCFTVYFAYESYLNKKYPERHKKALTQEQISSEKTPTTTATTTTESSVVSAENEPSSIILPTVEYVDAVELTLETTTSTYLFDQDTGGLKSVKLKNFKAKDHETAIDLIDNTFVIQPRLSEKNPGLFRAPFTVNRLGPRDIEFSRTVDQWNLTHKYTLGEGYEVDLEVKWMNQGRTRALDAELFVSVPGVWEKAKGSFLPGFPTERSQWIVRSNSTVERFAFESLCGESASKVFSQGKRATVDFFGVDKHYFLSSLIPHADGLNFQTLCRTSPRCEIDFTGAIPYGSISAGSSQTMKLSGWFGPKNHEMTTFKESLSESKDLGWFGSVSHILLQGLRIVQGVVGNWGLAIALLTILLKLLLLPLAYTSAVSMKRVQKAQPELSRIKEKYKDDPTRCQQETMRFMSEHKVNPLKGCLPLLAQIPIFIAFWRVLAASIELRHATFFAWIQDLSAADPYYVFPLMAGGLMFVQQKLMPTTTMDKTQEKIMMMIPVIVAVTMLTLPAGLVWYMIVSTAFSIAQQYWMNKKLT